MITSIAYQNDMEVARTPFFNGFSPIIRRLVLDFLLPQVGRQDILIDRVIFHDQDIDWWDDHCLLFTGGLLAHRRFPLVSELFLPARGCIDFSRFSRDGDRISVGRLRLGGGRWIARSWTSWCRAGSRPIPTLWILWSGQGLLAY